MHYIKLTLILFTGLLLFHCDKSSNPDNNQKSIITMTFAGESVTLDGGPSTSSSGHIQINGVSSSAYNGQLQILVAGSGPGTYDINSATIMFTSKEGQMHTADTGMVKYGAEVDLKISAMGPGLEATLTATVIQSFDPNFTQKEIKDGVISLTSDDFLISYD